MIAVIDYGMGNLRSVEKALERVGASVSVTRDPEVVRCAHALVVPGVGAFREAVRNLKGLGLWSPIKEEVFSGKPYLGICLGLQLLFEESEEAGRIEGLGIVPGRVVRIREAPKVPHMGWNRIQQEGTCPLFEGIADGAWLYFVHSYFGRLEDPSWASAWTEYGERFASAVWRKNLFATQFHPEKSQTTGLKILKNFVKYVEKVNKGFE